MRLRKDRHSSSTAGRQLSARTKRSPGTPVFADYGLMIDGASWANDSEEGKFIVDDPNRRKWGDAPLFV